MYRVSFLAMHEWMSDRKYQSATSDLGVEIAHGGGARSCSSASRDSLRTQVSEDTNKLCDAVSLSLGLHSEADTYDAEQPPSRRESAPGEDGFAHASRELPEAGKRAHSPCFRTQVEGRRPGPPSGWFESFQRKRDDHPLRMSYLQLKDAADAESSKEFHRNRGLPPNHSVSVHCRSLDESDAPFSQSEEIMQKSIRQPNAVENAVDQWPKNAFAQTSGTFKTDLEYPCPSRASLCWDGAGRTAAQPSRHCHVPSMNYSPYDLFLRNCSDYSLCSPPLSFNGQYPESYYPGGIYGRIPATAALPRPCEWTSGRSSLSPGFRLEDMMPMSLLLAAPRVCQICGDVASGCHYGALTCGSCKVFFKRAAEGKQNFLCASRNDCTIDKLRRKNCPSCRLKRCFESGMTLRSRKLKVIDSQKPLERSDSSGPSAVETAPSGSAAPAMVPAHLLETLHSVLGHIEPLMVHAGHDAAQPDSATALLTSLNQLGERQLVSVVKWAKGVPGFRNLHVDDQMMAIQYSWMVIMVFGLGWRSFTEANATHLFFAPDLVFNEQRMHASGMYEDCVRLRQLSQRFSALRVSREEFLCMKALLLFSFIPAEGLKSQSCFDELRSTYINELGRLVTTREHGNRNERLFQLTQLLDYLQLIVQKLHQFTYDLYLQTLMLQTKVNFPEMISEIISVHVPKILRGLVKPILFHK